MGSFSTVFYGLLCYSVLGISEGRQASGLGLYNAPLGGPTVLCYLKAFYLLLQIWCLSGSHQSISGILLC